MSSLVGLVLGVAYLVAPPMGTDLSAQVARARFFAGHGWAALDFGWYGGVSPYGYSMVSPQLMAWLGGDLLGPRVLGVLAAVLSAAALAELLVRTGASRPVLGGVLGAGCFYGNLVSGRVTYALGVAFGLLAILALTSRRRWWRTGGALAGSALATLTSPVAGLFVGLAGAAWTLSGLATPRPRPAGPSSATPSSVTPSAAGPAAPGPAAPDSAPAGRWRGRLRAVAPRFAGGAPLMAGAGAAMVAMALVFGAGGWMNISRWDTARAAGAGLIVALFVPRPAIRIGALLASAGVLTAYAVHTPVGLNATRLAAMFTLPVLAAYASLPRLAGGGASRAGDPAADHAGGPSRGPRAAWAHALFVGAVLVAAGLWQPPVMTGDLRGAGDPAAQSASFAGLRAELSRRGPVGRVEVVPLANYWDAAYVPATVPLARGWLRQADLAHNPIFYDGTLTADEYEHWLRDNGVEYVALSEDRPSWVGRAEAALIRAGLPYLTEVWRDGRWILYQVAGHPSIVEGAVLVASTQAGVTVDAPAGDTLVRLRWSGWLSVRQVAAPPLPNATAGPAIPACLARHGEWVSLHATRPGRYQVTSSLLDRGPFCHR